MSKLSPEPPNEASAERPLSPRELRRWVEIAEPGQRRPYWRGYLAKECGDVPIGGKRVAESPEVLAAREARKTALELYEQGLITLAQRKLTDRSWSYLAVRR
jgi:hypothetical protein